MMTTQYEIANNLEWIFFIVQVLRVRELFDKECLLFPVHSICIGLTLVIDKHIHIFYKNIIRGGGSTALNNAYIVDTVYTIQTALHCLKSDMHAYNYQARAR